ncbi:MAG TPA: GGDEF domain-containing protein, partial [Spirochaetota bacterium]|nr:GGDEF domain-containing protein [Spirochaetota bacterium]
IAEVNELAIRDGLTGLYNRRYMDEVIQHIVYQWKRADSILGFLMVDVDFFKKYNDTYGHQAGDKLLRSFSGMLSSLLRRESDYVFRYGGEEFAILLPSTNHETTEKFAHLIIKRTQSLKISHSASPLGLVTVSIGAVSFKSSKKRDIEEIVGLADEALYEAKNSGRNKVVSKIFNEEI